MNGKIYIIRNSENDKVYIGQTIRSVTDRLRQHKKLCRSNQNQLIYKAIRKYGADKFFVEELESGIETQKELNEKEAEYIKRFNSLAPNGYNLSPGGALWRRRPRFSDEEDELIAAMYLKGMSQREIAKQFGVDHTLVGSALTRKGIKSRPKGCNLPDRSSKIKESDLYKMYVVEGMMVKDIAAYYGVDVRTVSRAITRFNLREYNSGRNAAC